MSDELVAEVLVKIERLERAANEALTGSGTWVSGPRRDHPGYEIAELRTGWVHTQTQQSGQAAHMAINDPKSVLRLCRAHRDIVDLWKYASEAHAGLGRPETEERLFALTEVIKAVARGLGVEETTDE